MLLTLLKALKTNDLSIVAGNIDLAPIDVDVLLYEAQENGDIEIDKEKGTIKALKEPEELYRNEHLESQISKLTRFYDQQEANITRTRLDGVVLAPTTGLGYKNHDYVCTMYALEEDANIKTYEITVPKKGKQPPRTFKFYTFLNHQEFGEKAVNNFIAQFDKK